MSTLQKISWGYAIVLLAAASLNYIPGLTDENGLAFGVFALDIFDDSLHIASAIWAAIAAWMSHNASRTFLFWFGLLYFADGLMGLMFGSGYLDFGIITYGVVDLPLKIKVLGNLPHLLLGGFAVLASRVWSQPSSKHE